MLRLVSADAIGVMVVWDVCDSVVLSNFSELNVGVLGKKIFHKNIADIQWITNQRICRDLLASLHVDGKFIVWNFQTKSQLWCYSFMESVYSFCLDPFSNSNIICKLNYVTVTLVYSKDTLIIEKLSLSVSIFGKGKHIQIPVHCKLFNIYQY